MPNNSKINLQTGRATQARAPQPQAVGVNSEIDKAQRLLEELRIKKEEEERREAQLQRILTRRKEFETRRAEVLSKISDAMPVIEQELSKGKQELTDLEQARKHFQHNLKNIESINPSRWEDEDVLTNAEKYENFLTKTAREYDQFSSVLKKGTNHMMNPFQSIVSGSSTPLKQFGRDVLRGFAFSLPLIIALTITLLASKG